MGVCLAVLCESLCVRSVCVTVLLAHAGPFSSSVDPGEALQLLSGLGVQLHGLKQEESSIRQGLSFFSIEQPPSKDIQSLDKVSSIIAAPRFLWLWMM